MVELFTVAETRQNKQGTVLLPGFSLADKRPEIQKLMQGCMPVLILWKNGLTDTLKVSL